MNDLTATGLYLTARAGSVDAAAERRRAQLDRLGPDTPASPRISLRAWLTHPIRSARPRRVTTAWHSGVSRHLPA